MRIKASVDFLDNTILGGTPDYAGYLNRYDVPLSAFTPSAAPPEALDEAAGSGMPGASDGAAAGESAYVLVYRRRGGGDGGSGCGAAPEPPAIQERANPTRPNEPCPPPPGSLE